MKKFLALVCLSLFAGSISAQSDDFKKGEFYVGYTHNRVSADNDELAAIDDTFDDNRGFNGVEVSGVYNFHRYLGVKGDFSAAFNNKNYGFNYTTGGPVFTTGRVSLDTSNQLYNALGGIQIKDNSSDAKVKPFAHVLAGIGHGRTSVKNLVCPPGVDCSGLAFSGSETGFAGAFGGGVDVKLNDKLDLRLIQVDYNPIRFDGYTMNNVRFGVGIVFK